MLLLMRMRFDLLLVDTNIVFILCHCVILYTMCHCVLLCHYCGTIWVIYCVVSLVYKPGWEYVSSINTFSLKGLLFVIRFKVIDII